MDASEKPIATQKKKGSGGAHTDRRGMNSRRIVEGLVRGNPVHSETAQSQSTVSQRMQRESPALPLRTELVNKPDARKIDSA